MISLKLNVDKIDKALLFQGTKGIYLDAVLMNNRDGKDDHGYDGFIVQSVSKEKRLAGERGPIIGNWKNVETAKKPAPDDDWSSEPARTKPPF